VSESILPDAQLKFMKEIHKIKQEIIEAKGSELGREGILAQTKLNAQVTIVLDQGVLTTVGTMDSVPKILSIVFPLALAPFSYTSFCAFAILAR
jgi:hypothetical protein